jgi:hypothetical protein
LPDLPKVGVFSDAPASTRSLLADLRDGRLVADVDDVPPDQHPLSLPRTLERESGVWVSPETSSSEVDMKRIDVVKKPGRDRVA